LRTGIVAGEARGSMSVTVANVCTHNGTLQFDYTKEVLEYRIDAVYLTYALFELSCEVSLSPCGGRRPHLSDGNDVTISVTVRGNYESVLFSADDAMNRGGFRSVQTVCPNVDPQIKGTHSERFFCF